jgi:uncharacterized cupredoxin-like copper-binding protein
VKYFLLLTLLLAPAWKRAAQPPRNLTIVGTDYAFAVPATVRAGLTSFHFRNDGKHAHEFNIFLLKPGVTIDQIVAAAKADKPQLPMIEGAVGVLFAEPGSMAPAGLATNLLPGRDYGILCIFRDSANAPRHYAMGMYSVIHVTGQRSTSTLAADSIVAVDYAFSHYPRQLSPGSHAIAFKNNGKHRHEFNMTLLRKGITLDSIVERDKKGVDVDDLFEKNGGVGVLHAQAGNAALGALTIDFLPGREYMIDCSFSDDEKSPPHYKLGMYGSIKVRSQ